jgi:F0F1-type ATP synthase assembly protein I
LPKSDRDEFYKLIRQLGMLTFIPMVLLSGPLAGFLLGKWLDFQFKAGQWLIILFVVLGFLAAARESFRIIQRVSREDKDKP